MRNYSRTLILAGLAFLAGCSDDSTPSTAPLPTGRGVGVQALTKAPSLGVGTIGVVVDVRPNERHLVIEQFGVTYQPPPGGQYREARVEFAVGSRRNRLQVNIKKDTTKIYLKDLEKPLENVSVGDTVLVVGQERGASLHADFITDLSRLDRADSTIRKLPKEDGLVSNPQAGTGPVVAAVKSLCMGQDLDYTGANILEFQGCWGGPNASDDLDTPFIPLFCPLIGCVGIDRFSYTLALGGWSYAFPFRFEAAASPGLVYHVPGNVELSLVPLPATTGSFTFSGGIGFDFGLNLDFCSFFGCYDMFTVHLSAFSMIHQATGPGPLAGRLEIGEPSCPAIGLFPIEGVPIDPLSIGFCEDLGLEGREFNSDVRSFGANPNVSARYGFTNVKDTAVVRPDAMQVGLRYDQFAWSPYMTMGLYFRFKIFQIPVWDTPSIPFGEIGPFDAVTTPFPLPGSVFTVATDPLSPVPELWYLEQPTSLSLTLAVAKAPTVVRITSANVLTEGTPVTVRLTEEYDGSAIAGQPITIQATGLHGTVTVSVMAPTNAQGIASIVLPVGEYDVTASFAGSDTYLPASDRMALLYVYRPTTFVIWGGNAGGIAIGARYQFWGQGWTKQITGGAWSGNPSFQGFAIPATPTTWESPPASSGRGPASVPDLIGVIITTSAQDRGSRTTGNIVAHALLRVDAPASYRPDGGHGATGVVRITLP